MWGTVGEAEIGGWVRHRVALTITLSSIVLAWCACAFALNPDRDIHQLAHRSWGTKEGYPGRADAMAQTADGFLWLGTDIGLFRFDGVHFERYVPGSGDQLSEGAVYSLLALPDGNLWIVYGFENKICVLRNGNVKCYGKADGVASYPVTIIQDYEGNIWASTWTGLIRFNGTRWEHIGIDWNFPEDVPHLTSDVLFVDRRGTLWVGVNQTVLYLKQGSKRFEQTGAFAGWSISIAEAPDGTIWLSDNQSYVRAISTSVSAKSAATAKCEVATHRGALPNCPSEVPLVVKISAANDLLFDRNGNLWVATDTSGVVRVPHPERLKDRAISKTSEALQTFNSKDGLSADSCFPVLEDREGNIWVATRDGLDQFRDTALVPVALPTSLYRVGIAPADGGDIWVGGSWNYIARIHGDTRNVPLILADVFKPYRDPFGVTWLMGNSLSQWKDGRFRKVAPSPDDIDGSLGSWQVADDGLGKLWAFSSGHGFFTLDHNLDNDRWKAWPTPPEVASQSVTDIFSDSTGRVWVSTSEGDIITLDKGNIVDYPVKPDSPLRNVKAFAERSQHEIWAGGVGGLALIESGQIRPIRPAASDSLKDVTGIVDAGSDGLWLNTANGVIHIPRDEAERALRDPSYRFQMERIDPPDGLLGQTETLDPYPKAIQGTDGRIWFTAGRGLAWIDPKTKISRNVIPPPVYIEAITANGKPYDASNGLQLPPHVRDLTVDYTALSFVAPEKIHFRYKLDGQDPNWREVVNDREVQYSNLPPGAYHFHVVASNNDGVWNEAGAVLDFSVLPAWYQTAWFRAMCVAAFFLLLWFIYQMRLRQVAKSMAARFDERLQERTRIARDFHDTYLQTIQGSKLVADAALKRSPDPTPMRNAMEQLSVWLGRATDEGRAALSSLRASATETNDLAAAFQRAIEECRINSSMDTAFSLTGEVGDMHPVVRDEVYRIGYEAIRNACVHSQATRLQVDLTYADDLTLCVRDNGVGIEPAIVDGGKEEHFGLPGMRERARRIMAKFTINTAAGSGTEVALVVPGGIIYRRPNSGGRKWPGIESLLKRVGLKADSADS